MSRLWKDKEKQHSHNASHWYFNVNFCYSIFPVYQLALFPISVDISQMDWLIINIYWIFFFQNALGLLRAHRGVFVIERAMRA